jgi:hypothetical protein
MDNGCVKILRLKKNPSSFLERNAHAKRSLVFRDIFALFLLLGDSIAF